MSQYLVARNLVDLTENGDGGFGRAWRREIRRDAKIDETPQVGDGVGIHY